jgi:hypothetical protein
MNKNKKWIAGALLAGSLAGLGNGPLTASAHGELFSVTATCLADTTSGIGAGVTRGTGTGLALNRIDEPLYPRSGRVAEPNHLKPSALAFHAPSGSETVPFTDAGRLSNGTVTIQYHLESESIASESEGNPSFLSVCSTCLLNRNEPAGNSNRTGLSFRLTAAEESEPLLLDSSNRTATLIPEPSSATLFCVGLVLALAYTRGRGKCGPRHI